MRRPRISSKLLALLCSLGAPNALAGGIPTIDVASVAQIVEQIKQSAVASAKQQALAKGQMALDEEMGIQLQDTVANAEAQSALVVTSTLEGAHNQGAVAMALPPVSACATYNTTRNAQVATATALQSKAQQTSRLARNYLHVNPASQNYGEWDTAQKQPIYSRFIAATSQGQMPQMFSAENFFRAGRYEGRDITPQEAQARQDFLDLMADAQIAQRIDWRRDPGDMTSPDDQRLAISQMKDITRLSIAQEALAHVFSLYDQGSSGVSVAQVLQDFNEQRLLNPDWMSQQLNKKSGQESIIQPEQIARESFAIDVYRAYLQHQQSQLQQRSTALQAIQTIMQIEAKQ